MCYHGFNLDGSPTLYFIKDSDHLSDLDRIALAAYNHGGLRVILTKHKAYLVTSDLEEDTAEVAREAAGGRAE